LDGVEVVGDRRRLLFRLMALLRVVTPDGIHLVYEFAEEVRALRVPAVTRALMLEAIERAIARLDEARRSIEMLRREVESLEVEET